MSTLDGFPLPATARHDASGSHYAPYIPEWRNAADPEHYAYDSNRIARGGEIQRDQQQKVVFAAHLAEHRRRGEDATVIDHEES